MGTNFYGKLNGELVHIGKRSAAGLYCWRCGVTLCREGIKQVHFTDSDDISETWFTRCPKCGQRPKDESSATSSVGRELGFNKTTPKPKHDSVLSCSSFTWAIEPALLPQITGINDEYRRRYTRSRFQAVLSECPITYTDSIGRDFS